MRPRRSTLSSRPKGAAAFFLFAILPGLLLGCAQSEGGFVIKPYLQQPGLTEMTVMWTARDVRDTELRFGPEGEPLTLAPRWYHHRRTEFKRTDYTMTPEQIDALPTESEYICEAWLSGLTPGTRYRYRVTCGGASEEGAFRTFPEKPESFTFAVYGDSRSQPKVHRRVAEALLRAEPAFILHTGDLVARGGFHEYPEHFFGPAQELLRRIPVLVARGNHDKGLAYNRLFRPPGVGDDWYSFDYGNAHIVGLNSADAWSEGKRDRLIAWLSRDLADSHAEWKFVFYHHPTYDIGGHYTRWGREDFTPIFRAHGVDMAFSGHSHTYQRFYPMFTPGQNDAHPITYVVAAGGGAPLHRTEASPFSACTTTDYHFVLIEIRGGTLTGRALTPDGKVIDTFTLTKRDGKYTPEVLASARDETQFDTLRESIAPYLHVAAMLPDKPTTRHPVKHGFELPAVEGQATEYELTLEQRSRAKWSIGEPIRGRIEAGGTARITFTIRAVNTRVEYYRETTQLLPWARLRLAYKINGKNGWVYSSTLRVSTDEQRREAIEAIKAGVAVD